MSHTGFVADEGSQMDLFLGIISGEGPYSSSVVSCSSSWQEGE